MQQLDATDVPVARRGLPTWVIGAWVVVGGLWIAGAHATAAWILHLNAVRAIAGVMAESVGREDAAATATAVTRPPPRRIDPLNPSTWGPDPSLDPEAERQRQARLQVLQWHVGVVEIDAEVWKWTMTALLGVAVLLCIAGAMWRRRQTLLLFLATSSLLLASAATVAAMHACVVYGGFPPRPAWNYVLLALVTGTYPAGVMMGALATARRGGVPMA